MVSFSQARDSRKDLTDVYERAEMTRVDDSEIVRVGRIDFSPIVVAIADRDMSAGNLELFGDGEPCVSRIVTHGMRAAQSANLEMTTDAPLEIVDISEMNPEA